MSDIFDPVFSAIAFIERDCGDAVGAETMADAVLRARPDVDPASVPTATLKALCRSEYWGAVGGDDLPPSVALVAFGAAVYSGARRAVEWLQMGVSAPVTGVIDAATVDAAWRVLPAGSCTEMVARRLVFLAQLPAWRTAGTVWARRVSGLALLAGSWNTR